MIVGQERVVEETLTAIFCGGNVLLEGVPGLGKTELVKALSRVLDLDFRRIQFTPDLMPADIIGTRIMTTNADGRYEFEFRPGPIFTQLLLADEINRATPKTQSALLETMQEGSVTTAGTIYQLKQPFFVMATQNPIEQEGTYPLPEAQLDRFLFKVEVPFLNRSELNDVVMRTILKRPTEPKKLLDSDRILGLRKVLDKVVVADPIRDYAVRLVLSTHPGTDFATDEIRKYVRWGASPRAAQVPDPCRTRAGLEPGPRARRLRRRAAFRRQRAAAPRAAQLRRPGGKHDHADAHSSMRRATLGGAGVAAPGTNAH